MFKKILVLTFLFLNGFLLSAKKANNNLKDTYEVVKELKKLKETDAYIKEYLQIQDPSVQYLLECVKRAGLIANQKHKEQIRHNFIYILGLYLKSVVSVTREQMPKLYSLVEDMTTDVPFLFICFDEKVYNAFAMIYSKELKGIVLSEQFINDLSDKELKTVIAHELGHIVKDTEKKITIFDPHISVTKTFVALASASCIIPSLFSINSEYIKNHKVLTSIKGVLLSSSLAYLGIFAYVLYKKKHNKQDEIDADKYAVDITQDPQAFARAMEVIKRHFSNDFNSMENGLNIAYKNLEELKKSTGKSYNFLGFIITFFKKSVEYYRKMVFELGTNSYPSLDERIEFGKK